MVTLKRGKRLTPSLINTKQQLTSLSLSSRQRCSWLRSATTIVCLLLLLLLLLLLSSLQYQYRGTVVDLKRLRSSPDADADANANANANAKRMKGANSNKREEMQAADAAVSRQQQQQQQQPAGAAATQQQQEVGQSQLQLSHASAMNRYPDEYAAVRDYLHGRDDVESTNNKGAASNYHYNLLSFGSATGEEAITLATMYYPDNDNDNGGGENTVSIFGVDLHQDSINKARASWVRIAAAATTNNNNNGGNRIIPEGKVTFLNGKETSISVYGLYDAIFANSVLCSHATKGATPASILQKYPFAQFEASVGYLDASLKVGGVLAIVNANYHFARSEISTRYTPLLGAQCINFVPKVDAETV